MAVAQDTRAAAVAIIQLVVARVGLFVWFLYSAVAGMPGLLNSDRFTRRRVVNALFEVALQPLPVITMLASLAGLVAAFSASRALGVVHLEEPLLLALRDALMREVMPLLVGIFVAGRSGVGLAVRIGRMNGSGEIESLRLMGVDPARYVLPASLLAFVTAGAALLVWGMGVAHLTAALLLQHTDAIPVARYVHVVFAPAAEGDFWAGFKRVEIYALISLGIAAAEGASVGRDPQALETAARSSFVLSLLAIFAAAALMTGVGL